MNWQTVSFTADLNDLCVVYIDDNCFDETHETCWRYERIYGWLVQENIDSPTNRRVIACFEMDGELLAVDEMTNNYFWIVRRSEIDKAFIAAAINNHVERVAIIGLKIKGNQS